MKNFIIENLQSSNFTLAALDYKEYIGNEKYKEIQPEVLYFALHASDTINSVKTILNMAIKLNINMIIIDFNTASEELISNILEYMEDTTYMDFESYNDKFIFGKTIL